jgi:hypothetical protein
MKAKKSPRRAKTCAVKRGAFLETLGIRQDYSGRMPSRDMAQLGFWNLRPSSENLFRAAEKSVGFPVWNRSKVLARVWQKADN